MWNFLVAGLSLECTLVLYDGSPLRDVSLLWKLVDDLKITIFGTSAKYFDHLSVRCYDILSTFVDSTLKTVSRRSIVPENIIVSSP